MRTVDAEALSAGKFVIIFRCGAGRPNNSSSLQAACLGVFRCSDDMHSGRVGLELRKLDLPMHCIISWYTPSVDRPILYPEAAPPTISVSRHGLCSGSDEQCKMALPSPI